MAAHFGNSFEQRHCAACGVGIYEKGVEPFQQRWEEWIWNYKLEHGGAEPYGVRIPDEFFPKQVRLTKGKRIYDFSNHVFSQAVSDRFKNVIEDIEPGVHQFMPLEILHKDGTPYGEPFWAFNICSMIDAVHPDSEGVKLYWYTSDPVRDPDFWKWKLDVDVKDFKQKLAVSKEKIEGRAAWIDERYMKASFLSDAVLERLHAEGMEGFDEKTYWKEI